MTKRLLTTLSRTLLGAVTVIAVAACDSTPPPIRDGSLPPRPDTATETRPKGKGTARDASSKHAQRTPVEELEAASDESLDLDRALELAEISNPELRAARAVLAAATARETGAGLFPNPDLEVTMESASFGENTTGDAEYIAGLVQDIPLGGRLGAGERVAAAQRHRAALRAVATRLRVRENVRLAFFAALHADETVRALEDRYAAAADGVRLAQALVDAGESSPADVARAGVEEGRAGLALDDARSLERNAREGLVTAIGLTGKEPDDVGGGVALEAHEDWRLTGRLDEALDLPRIQAARDRLGRSPAILEGAAAVREMEARVDLARSRRVPDVSLGAFYRRLEGESGHLKDAFDIGLAMPIPLFDSGRSGVAAAEAGLDEARHRAELVRSTVLGRARTLVESLGQSLRTAVRYRDSIDPGAADVLESMEARYRAGDVSLADVLPVRRERWDIRLAYLDALRDVAVLYSRLRALTGGEGSDRELSRAAKSALPAESTRRRED